MIIGETGEILFLVPDEVAINVPSQLQVIHVPGNQPKCSAKMAYCAHSNSLMY